MLWMCAGMYSVLGAQTHVSYIPGPRSVNGASVQSLCAPVCTLGVQSLLLGCHAGAEILRRSRPGPRKRRVPGVLVFLLCDRRGVLSLQRASVSVSVKWGDSSVLFSSLVEDQRSLPVGRNSFEPQSSSRRGRVCLFVVFYLRKEALVAFPTSGRRSGIREFLLRGCAANPKSHSLFLGLVGSGLLGLPALSTNRISTVEIWAFRSFLLKSPCAQGLQGPLWTFLPVTWLGKHMGLQISYSSSRSGEGELKQSALV